MKMTANHCRLFAFVSANDADIVRPFVQHYRTLGVDRFQFILHGPWTDGDLAALNEQGVEICERNFEPYSDRRKRELLQKHIFAAQGEWIVHVDADEFLELPCATIAETVRYLDFLGAEDLPAVLLQRVAEGGQLVPLGDATDLNALFPYFDYGLCERMEIANTIWKGKYPLVRVGPRFRTTRGNHLPHLERAAALAPIRAVLHHFKWRDRLPSAIGMERGEDSNSSEMKSYGSWLERHEGRVPVEGLEVYSRAALFQRGYLVLPERQSLKQLAVLRQAREVRLGKREPTDGLRRLLGRIPTSRPDANGDGAGASVLERPHLTLRPGRVALVTTEINGPDQSGGIGTAMAALAERLADHGHDVHVFLCVWFGTPELRQAVLDYWSSRGVTLHYHPRAWVGGPFPAHSWFTIKLSEALAADTWDVIHYQEAAGYAAVPLLLRAAGLAFQGTQIVLTSHGPSQWHKRGNFYPWLNEESWHTYFEEIALHLADLVVCPTAYIREWLREHYSADSKYVVIPNSLTAEARRFVVAPKARRTVKALVFFGRIEIRKGIDRFLEAVASVIRQGVTDFEVVFLGGFGESFTKEDLQQRIAGWPVRIRIITNYDSNGAVHFLRNTECLAVVPSRLDNLPYTVFECLENGIPIITSNIGGIPEMVVPAEWGRVLVAGDVNRLASQLKEVLEQGVAPATLAFDPTLADVDLMALHAGLVEAARQERLGGRQEVTPPKVTVALYGTPAPAVCEAMLGVLDDWVTEGRVTEVLFTAEFAARAAGLATRVGSVFQPVPGAGTGDGSACNRLAERARNPALLFWGGLVEPRPEALAAMTNVMLRADADAVVCGYSVSASATTPARDVYPFGGPPELVVRRNAFGRRFFLITKAVLQRTGGFSTDSEVDGITDWELLNRIKASGGRVATVPTPIATSAAGAMPDRGPAGEALAERLAAPWVDQAPPHLQGLLRMGLSVNGWSPPPAAPASIVTRLVRQLRKIGGKSS